jgi:hypothetical protein
MTTKAFGFINPHKGGRNSTGELTAEEKNWQHLMENFKSVTIPLQLGSVVGTTTVVGGGGNFVLLGPLVFVSILLDVPNNSGWTTANIRLPFTEANSRIGTSIATYGIGGASWNVYNVASGALKTTTWLDTPPVAGQPLRTNLKFAAAYTNVSGATEVYAVSGCYLRE